MEKSKKTLNQILLKDYYFIDLETTEPLTRVEVYVDNEGFFTAKAFDGFLQTDSFNTLLQAEETISRQLKNISSINAKDLLNLASAVIKNAVKKHDDGTLEIKPDIFYLLLKNSSVVKLLEP